MVADIEELEEMDASELHARRLNAKEAAKKWKLHFPVRRRNSQHLGEEQRVRTSTLTWERPERGEEQEILQGKSDELHSPTPFQEDSTRDDEEAISDFWTITREFICRHHVQPRAKLYVPKEESFLIPLKYIDVTRTTHTFPNILLEKHIEDYRNVDGGEKIIGCMDRLHKIYFIERKAN